MPLSAQQLLSLTTSVGLNVPPPPCLPIYSTSGFDIMSILARVATHSHPKIILGPVNLTCSFVVVDVCRYDRPIIYAFPSFYQLTEYEDHEVIGRNCRFLQSPDGNVHNGEERLYVAPKTVQHLYKAVVSDKECQANYGAGAPAILSLPAPPPRERRAIISKNLQALLSDPAFVNSLPISTSTIAPTSENTHDKAICLT